MGMFRRRVPGNTRVVTALVFGPDPWSMQAASLGAMTGTYSPGSAGVHSPGAGTRGFVGDRGYGVNRASGAGLEPIQRFAGLAAPVITPKSQRLGAGAGVAGQPGLPSTGDLSGAWGWSLTPGMG